MCRLASWTSNLVTLTRRVLRRLRPASAVSGGASGRSKRAGHLEADRPPPRGSEHIRGGATAQRASSVTLHHARAPMTGDRPQSHTAVASSIANFGLCPSGQWPQDIASWLPGCPSRGLPGLKQASPAGAQSAVLQSMEWAQDSPPPQPGGEDHSVQAAWGSWAPPPTGPSPLRGPQRALHVCPEPSVWGSGGPVHSSHQACHRDTGEASPLQLHWIWGSAGRGRTSSPRL